MIRRSGVSPAVNRWKLSCEMLRRAASGHIEATHWSKFAAASRIADAVISGWPEAPSSPLQGCGPLAPGAVCGGAEAPEFGAEKMFPNRLEIPPPDDCALASPAPIKAAAIMTAAVSVLIDGSIGCFISHSLPVISGFQEAPSRFPTV